MREPMTQHLVSLGLSRLSETMGTLEVEVAALGRRNVLILRVNLFLQMIPTHAVERFTCGRMVQDRAKEPISRENERLSQSGGKNLISTSSQNYFLVIMGC